MIEKFDLSRRDNVKSFEDRVMDAYITYCRIKHVFPKVIGVSMSHAGYKTPILETRIDKTLLKDDFWLSAK